jgi:hypothetical protein
MPQNDNVAVEEDNGNPTLDTMVAWVRKLGLEMYELFVAGKRDPTPLRQDSMGTLSV